MAESGIGRRDLLKRGAVVGGALVWATPVVQTVGIRPALAGTPVILACPDGSGSTPPTSLTFQYTGESCKPQAERPEALTLCTQSCALSGTIRVVAFWGGSSKGHQHTSSAEWNNVSVGDTIITGKHTNGSNVHTGNQGLGKMNPDSFFEVYVNGTLCQDVKFHTSCSAPLFLNDEFGAHQLKSATFD